MKSIATTVVSLALAATLAPAGASGRAPTQATWLGAAVATEASLSVKAPEPAAAVQPRTPQQPVFGAPSPVPFPWLVPSPVRMETSQPTLNRVSPQGPRTSFPGRP
jgi:hypothetical protein